MRWYMDEVHYYTAHSRSSGPVGQPQDGGWYTAGPIGQPGPHAPFDSPFYLILNLAVGSPSTVFTNGVPLGDTLAQPKQLLVDWVRVHGLPYVLSQVWGK